MNMEQACQAAKDTAGGSSALAAALGGLTSQAVSQWRRVPAGRAIEVEKLTKISRYKLRPDIFGAKK